MDLATLADPSALLEPLGVIPSNPNARPADILCTAALPGSTAALDIGIASPDAFGAGPDCCEALVRRELREQAAYQPELAAQGVRYIALAFSCYGRVHPEAASVIKRLATAAARRQGATSARTLECRTRCRLSVCIARRAGAMVRACVPDLPSEKAALLLGEDPAVGRFSAEGAPAAKVVAAGGLAGLAA